MHSFWEREQWFKNTDFAIVGSGIVGITCALHLRKKHPNSRIVIFEQGYLPSGASSKNAGFACFGSPSELLSDLNKMPLEKVLGTVEKRIKGLEKLKEICGTAAIDFEQKGSHEVFLEKDEDLFQMCKGELSYLNGLLKPFLKSDCYALADENIKSFGFKGVNHLIFNRFEGQIDTGKMIQRLLALCKVNDVEMVNGCTIQKVEDLESKCAITLANGFEFYSQKVFVATNGFAKKLLPELNIEPARAQVLVTKPISGLKIEGTFHMNEGYYYFRNVGNRVLFGGGRNLDFEGEKTTLLETTERIQSELNHLLKNVLLPGFDNFEIDMRWAGIMGVGNDKEPIVKSLSQNVACGVRMGGMGVAIGSLIGEELASLLK